MTNLEKVRSFNAEELAAFMTKQKGCQLCVVSKRCTDSPFSKYYDPRPGKPVKTCAERLVKWLNEESAGA